MSWFIWNGKNSGEMGLWVTTLPGETRAAERVTRVNIPGRSGHLTLLEGDYVYDSYVKECTVTARRDMDYDRVLDWLSGAGDVIFSSNPSRAYEARIASEVSFDPISNDLCQATIPFYCQPLKKQVPTEPNIVIGTQTASATIYNPGTVPSKPLVRINGYLGALVMAGASMGFSVPAFDTTKSYPVGACVSVNGTWYRFKTAHAGEWNASHADLIADLLVDCEAKTISAYINNVAYPFTGNFTGDFPVLPLGNSTVSNAGQATLTISPRWRWR